jgi:hypothetical protein
VPPDEAAFETLLRACTIERAFTELNQALVRQPERLQSALRGILRVVNHGTPP